MKIYCNDNLVKNNVIHVNFEFNSTHVSFEIKLSVHDN